LYLLLRWIHFHYLPLSAWAGSCAHSWCLSVRRGTVRRR